MTYCNACGSFVTKDFARVFGDNRGDVHACLECATHADISDGRLAATPRPAGP
jgi:hypothetical protein